MKTLFLVAISIILFSSFSYTQTGEPVLEVEESTDQAKAGPPSGPCSVGYLAAPYWESGQDKLYSQCPTVKVGIGTPSPVNMLDVIGKSYFATSMGVGTQPVNGVSLNCSTYGNVGICMNQLSTSGYSYAYKAVVSNPTSKGIGIYNDTYGKDVFTVYADGKIEVSNSTQKILQLDPNGVLRTREVKVDLQTWPDYVFDEEYNLLSLEEVKVYIDENGHLPNVPSAETIEKDGLALGEMNKILMEKLEELMLYTLDQQEQIDEMKEVIKEQQKKIEELGVNR